MSFSFIQLQFFLNKFFCQRKFSIPTIVWKVAGFCRQDIYVMYPLFLCFPQRVLPENALFFKTLPYTMSKPQSEATVACAPYIRASAMFLLVYQEITNCGNKVALME
jgi:hypothetical protein